jgi:hypothetical protein
VRRVAAAVFWLKLLLLTAPLAAGVLAGRLVTRWLDREDGR